MSVDLAAAASPDELIPGDPHAVREVAQRYSALAEAAADRDKRAFSAASIEWEGQTADAFRAAVGVHRARAQEEAAVRRSCAGSLEQFADVLSWAQGQAATALSTWKAAEAETAAARRAHERLVTKSSTGALGGARVFPIPPFVDTGAAGRAAAVAILQDARAAVEEAETETIRVLDRSAAAAPSRPLFGGGGTVRPVSMARPGASAIPVPGPTSSIPQIVAWLTTGAYTVGELVALCGSGAVLAALPLVVIGGVGSGSTAAEPSEAERRRRIAAAEARMRAQTRYPDGSLRPVAGVVPLGHSGLLLAEEGPTSEEEVKEILKETTKRGNNKPHREVETPEELAEVHEKLVQRGEPVDPPSPHVADTVQLPDGTRISYRNESGSGGPTIDIKYPGVRRITKVHLKDGWDQ
jgi:hypothetical protein